MSTEDTEMDETHERQLRSMLTVYGTDTVCEAMIKWVIEQNEKHGFAVNCPSIPDAASAMGNRLFELVSCGPVRPNAGEGQG